MPIRRAAASVTQFETDARTARRIAALIDEGWCGEGIAVALADGGGPWRLTIHARAAPDEQAARALVAAAAGSETAAALRFAPVAARDWIGASLAGLPPVAAGRFVVHGAHDRARIAVNRIGIEIEAALAFGTGHHATTRGCLLALDRLCKILRGRRIARRARRPRDRHLRVLDLGTGSGVLAIAAARALGARVLATDIDAGAVRVARANSRLNRVGTTVEVVKADGVAARWLQRAPFAVVLANILLEPLQRFAGPLRRLTAPHGRIVVSGIVPAQANAVIARYRPFALEQRLDLDGWTTLVFRRQNRARSP
jgi:ribosomal protein L11 methyltransferase